MSPDCVLNRPGYFGKCEWTLDESSLTIWPQSQPPEVYGLREIASVGGNESDVRLRHGGDALSLTRLGADGATLLEALHRTWPPQRADALRLSGTGTTAPYNGTWVLFASDGSPTAKATSVRALLYEDVLVLGGDDADLVPVFLSTLATVSFDAATHAVNARTWRGQTHRFAKLGDQTDEFTERLRVNRDGLTREAETAFASAFPTIDPVRRASLAALWPPGRLVSTTEAETVIPDFTAAWRGGWLAVVTAQRERCCASCVGGSRPHLRRLHAPWRPTLARHGEDADRHPPTLAARG